MREVSNLAACSSAEETENYVAFASQKCNATVDYYRSSNWSTVRPTELKGTVTNSVRLVDQCSCCF